MLFQQDNFTLASGKRSKYKIECDALGPSDWETIADIVGPHWKFGAVEGVPTGGLSFAKYLTNYITPGAPIVLIVDDVFTTGRSMERQRNGRPTVDQRSGRWHNAKPGDVQGIVLFARDFTPSWIDPIFSVMLGRYGPL